MEHYKYIHFLWSDELKFQRPIVEMINDSNGFFNPQEHLFLTPSEMVIKALGHYHNVVLYQSDNRNMADIINYYSKYADWLVSHGMANHVYLIKRKNIKKIVWRTWGGSRQKAQWDNRRLLNSIIGKCQNLIYYVFYRYSYGCSPVIGIANTVDVLDLEQWNWHKKSKLFYLNYWGQDFFQIIHNTSISKEDSNKPIKFLVGHQGCEGEHHIEIVQRLLSYKNENFEIYLPLSYGNKEYIQKVIDGLNSLDDERIHILDAFMPLKDYIALLASVDVAIFDEKSSMALGNINILLYFRKKILLNAEGILKKAFDKDHLPYENCNSVGVIPYTDLVKPVCYHEPLQSDIAYQPYEKQLHDWADMFNYLDSLKNNG